MKKVLFLCTGNSCRSQMAEAIVNARLDDEWQAVSAGTEPSGYVHPKAIVALRELGIELVVTVCDDAAENCPVWLGQGKSVHMGFPDPAKATGSEEAVMARFREVRDDIAESRSLP